jgi:hypothetical protein
LADAIARRLLVAVWHVLSKEVADRHAVPIDVARSLFAYAYRVDVRNLHEGQSAVQFTRTQLDWLRPGVAPAPVGLEDVQAAGE